MTANPILISTPDDPRIADYTQIRERDLTGRDGKFIIEGKVTLEVALSRSAFEIESLLLSEKRADSYLPQISDQIGERPVYIASQSLMDTVAGFPVHRGILAIGKKPTTTPLADWLSALPDVKTLVVCIGLSNHDNAGAVFRNAAALGGDAIILDAESCDPLYRKSIRVSAGTALWLPFHHGGQPAEIFAALKANGFALWALTPRADALSLYTAPQPDRLALILGPEGPGLSDHQIASGTPIRIPMTSEIDSLNVATSLAIALSSRLSTG